MVSTHSPKEYISKVTKPRPSSALPVLMSFLSSAPLSPLIVAAAMDDIAPSR